tara:strand:- start:6067 stop:6516 length:450 start_codon:yes stop_codon:yes gene_type:complete
MVMPHPLKVLIAGPNPAGTSNFPLDFQIKNPYCKSMPYFSFTLENKKIKIGDSVEVSRKFKSFKDKEGNPVRFASINTSTSYGSNIDYDNKEFEIERSGTVVGIFDMDHALISICEKTQGKIEVRFHKQNLQLPEVNIKAIISAWRKTI